MNTIKTQCGIPGGKQEPAEELEDRIRLSFGGGLPASPAERGLFEELERRGRIVRSRRGVYHLAWNVWTGEEVS